MNGPFCGRVSLNINIDFAQFSILSNLKMYASLKSLHNPIRALLKASFLTRVNIASVLYIACGKRGWSALADHSVML